MLFKLGRADFDTYYICILSVVFGRLLWLSGDLDPTHNACYHKHKWSFIIKHLAVFTIRNASLQNICYFLPSAGYHSKFVFNWHLRPIGTGIPPCVWAKCHAARWTSVLVCQRASFHTTYKSEWLHFSFADSRFANLKTAPMFKVQKMQRCFLTPRLESRKRYYSSMKQMFRRLARAAVQREDYLHLHPQTDLHRAHLDFSVILFPWLSQVSCRIPLLNTEIWSVLCPT